MLSGARVRSVHVVAGFSAVPGLAQVALAAAASMHVIVVTDDRDAPSLAGLAGEHVEVLEPEDLLPRGFDPLAEMWNAGYRTWLARIFPGAVADVPLYELLWMNVSSLRPFVDRIYAVALAVEIFRRHRPRALTAIGRLPPLCDTLIEDARDRGLDVTLIDVPDEPVNAARDWLLAAGRLVKTPLNGLLRVLERKRQLRVLRARLPQAPAATQKPSLWLALTPRWPGVSRHLVEAVAQPCEERGVPYGLAFQVHFGEPRDAGPDEHALLDGGLRPAAIDQLAGTTSVRAWAAQVCQFLPLAAGCLLGSARHLASLRIAGHLAHLARDRSDILTVATNDLWRILDARAATLDWLARTPEARDVVFGFAPLGEIKIADLLMQRRGIRTYDFVHCSVTEGDLATNFRAASSCTVAWTLSDAARFARLGASPRQIGGCMPRRTAVPERAPRGRILVATNYIYADDETSRRKYATHARRLAQSLLELQRHLGDRATLVFRPHPVEDREAWRALLGGAIALSDVPSLGDDLAAARVLITTKSSAMVEGLFHRIPILLHRGPVMEPATPFAAVPESRLFASGAELCARVDEALAASGPGALAPEDRLLELCFGPDKRPLDFLTSVLGIAPPVRSEPARASVRSC